MGEKSVSLGIRLVDARWTGSATTIEVARNELADDIGNRYFFFDGPDFQTAVCLCVNVQIEAEHARGFCVRLRRDHCCSACEFTDAACSRSRALTGRGQLEFAGGHVWPLDVIEFEEFLCQKLDFRPCLRVAEFDNAIAAQQCIPVNLAFADGRVG